MDDAFGHWLAGFIDGEGCFVIAPSGTRASGYRSFSCRFQLAVRLDDLAVLQEIADVTSLGHVFTYIKPTGGNRRPFAAWHVCSKTDAPGLVALLDRYPLRAKKAADFAIWRDAVAVWTSGHGRSDPTIAQRLGDLRAALRAERAYRIPATTEIEWQSPVIPPAVLRAG